MSNPGMTGQAIHFFFSVKPHDRRHQCRMTLKALQLCDFLIKSSNTQRFREVSCCKSQAVVPSINGFYNVFSVKKLRSVAVVTGGNGLMCAMVPPVINRLHNMTIGAGFGVIR